MQVIFNDSMRSVDMSIKKVLSIDFDYFIKVSASYRQKFFPEGGNELFGYAANKAAWTARYAMCKRMGDDLSLVEVDIKSLEHISNIVLLQDNPKFMSKRKISSRVYSPLPRRYSPKARAKQVLYKQGEAI